jgi:uncharacterized protein (TIGR02246 family)
MTVVPRSTRIMPSVWKRLSVLVTHCRVEPARLAWRCHCGYKVEPVSQLPCEAAMTDDERAIRDLVATWIDATKAGDIETVLRLMAEDVIFMVPGQKPFGKEAFAAALEGMKGVSFEGNSDIQEIQVFGDWAYLRSHLEVKVTQPSGAAPILRSGCTLSILRKTPAGQWVMARDANMLA